MAEMVYKKIRGVEVLKAGKSFGFEYLILSLGTHPTAYVNIPKGHKYYGADYSGIEIDVHGELTYANETIIESATKGWWIGWDYAHYRDFAGYNIDSKWDDDGYKYSTDEIFIDVKHVIRQLKGDD